MEPSPTALFPIQGPVTQHATIQTIWGVGHIPHLVGIKTKGTNRAILVRYLYSPEPNRYKVLDVASERIIKTRIADYRPYNPSFDPGNRYSQAFPDCRIVKYG